MRIQWFCPYLIVAAVLVALAIVIARFPLPAMGNATRRAAKEERKHHSLWRHRNLVFGVPAIFIYLIAEIGVANLFVNAGPGGLPDAVAEPFGP